MKQHFRTFLEITAYQTMWYQKFEIVCGKTISIHKKKKKCVYMLSCLLPKQFVKIHKVSWAGLEL